MLTIQQYTEDTWQSTAGDFILNDASSGVPVASYGCLKDTQIASALNYARNEGNPTLRSLTIHQRALILKKLGLLLLDRKEELYSISIATGATRADSWVDIEGGIGTMLSVSSIARRELPDSPFLVEGNLESLSPKGKFIARHILSPKAGAAIHINAFNFPIWGMLEKFAPSFIAGMPSLVKPATSTSYLTFALVKLMVESNLLPKGTLSLLVGTLHDLLDRLDGQDVLTFTGSANTASIISSNPNLIHNNVKINKEADSLNCILFGQSAKPDTDEFKQGAREILRELTSKCGQKCTAIRRVLVPEDHVSPLVDELKKQLERVVVAPPDYKEIKKGNIHMGPLVSLAQREELFNKIEQLKGSAELIYGDKLVVAGGESDKGGFVSPTVLLAKDSYADVVHDVEAFGPVCTLIPYTDNQVAINLANRGKGSLVASVVAPEKDELFSLVHGIAPYHGRVLTLSPTMAKYSTGHGSPLASLVHGGPGRAGGGEELGGARAIKYYMQRTALQGSPDDLTNLTKEFHTGAKVITTDKHPFSFYFNELEIGQSLTTHKRTVTEADIVNFGCLSGDHFYAHFDETAVTNSLFGKRVAHGYYLVSMAAGLFVKPGVGPVLANYGMDNLRFIHPVGIGDTIQAMITVKRKISKPRPVNGDKKTGVVVWQVELSNQEDIVVAVYDILTLVEDPN